MSEQKQQVGAKEAQEAPKAPKKNTRRRSPENTVSVPYTTLNVTLSAEHAQRVYRRTFDFTSKAFTQLGIILRMIGAEKEAIEVEKIVDADMKTIADDLKAERERLDVMLKDAGVAGSTNFSAPKEFEVQIFSPRSSRYLGMIREFDALIAQLTLLWLSGEIDDARYAATLYSWQRRFMKMSNSIRNIATRAISAANRKEDPAKKKTRKPEPAVSKQDKKEKDVAADVKAAV